MATYQILYWHDIPVQVRARYERQRVNLPLPDRFQLAVDLAAMEANLTGSDTYTDLFLWSVEMERQGSAQDVAEAVVAELISKFPTIEWRKTAESVKHGE
ncbi:MAG: hypothetical protein A2W33_03620 [Chloroflexi bacterium RBG_16_52_11]|nr:MAG: hypothetical protein A2W33_03620 [Chloroflexi bacterium RBG_16_52_11]